MLSTAAVMFSVGLASAEVVINRGNEGDPQTLDQHRTSTVVESRILKDLYEGLLTQDAEGKAVAGAAESWTVSEDGLVYTFTLRADGKWSNGEPVTAEDFAFSFKRIMDPATAAGYASVLYPIKNAEAVNTGKAPLDQLGVKAIDARTLEITLNDPTPYFLELLTHQTGLPVNKASVEANGDRFTQPGLLVTNGAYKLASFVPNDKITLVKNENFYDAANVKIDKVNWLPFEDGSACMRRFEAKELQTCATIPAEQLDYIKSNLADSYRIAPYLGVYYLPIKGKDGSPLRDPRVREAVAMVIDREFLANEVWRGTMLPGYSLVPPGVVNYVENPPMASYKDMDALDREDAAKKLLAEAGVAEGSLSVDLLYNTNENNKNTMSAVADNLASIGIKASLNEVEGTTYFSNLQNDAPFDIARAGWIGDYNDAQNFLFLFETGVSFNYSRWSNPEYDALMKKAAVTTDLVERGKILAEAETIALKDISAIPILYYSSKALVSPSVEGYVDNIMDVHGTRYMSLK
jgi:oligopeptide transport system substrate-binding protein